MGEAWGSWDKIEVLSEHGLWEGGEASQLPPQRPFLVWSLLMSSRISYQPLNQPFKSTKILFVDTAVEPRILGYPLQDRRGREERRGGGGGRRRGAAICSG